MQQAVAMCLQRGKNTGEMLLTDSSSTFITNIISKLASKLADLGLCNTICR